MIVPSILDRLIAPDEDQQGGVSDPAFLHSVERDILWLFNTSPTLQMEDPEAIRRFPHAAASVLNYGLRHVFGRTVNNLHEFERIIEDAISRFEPRMILDRKSLLITREGQLVEVRLEGRLIAQGGSKSVWIRTNLDTMESSLGSQHG